LRASQHLFFVLFPPLFFFQIILYILFFSRSHGRGCFSVFRSPFLSNFLILPLTSSFFPSLFPPQSSSLLCAPSPKRGFWEREPLFALSQDFSYYPPLDELWMIAFLASSAACQFTCGFWLPLLFLFFFCLVTRCLFVFFSCSNGYILLSSISFVRLSMLLRSNVGRNTPLQVTLQRPTISSPFHLSSPPPTLVTEGFLFEKIFLVAFPCSVFIDKRQCLVRDFAHLYQSPSMAGHFVLSLPSPLPLNITFLLLYPCCVYCMVRQTLISPFSFTPLNNECW